MSYDRINLFQVEIISDEWEHPKKGDVFHAIKYDLNNFLALENGRHYFISANDLKIHSQLYPPVRTPMQMVEEEMEKVK